VLVSSFLGPATASGSTSSPPLRYLGQGRTTTDGSRFGARQVAASWLRVFDSATRRSQRVAVPAGCELASVGGGQLLFTCSVGEANRNRPPVLFDIQAGTYREGPAPDPPLGLFTTATYDHVGTYWLRRTISRIDPHPAPDVAFLDWRTGRLIAEATSPHDTDDPDLPDLRRRLCAPLTRRRNQLNPDFTYPPFAEFEYEEPYGLDVASATLTRCGQSAARRLCRRCLPALGGGVAHWSRVTEKELTVGTEILSTGKRFRWRIPRSRFDSLRIAHTRERIYVSLGSVVGSAQRWRTYSAKLRRA